MEALEAEVGVWQMYVYAQAGSPCSEGGREGGREREEGREKERKRKRKSTR